MFDDFSFWEGFLVLVLVLFLTLASIVFFAPKNVDYYYVSDGSGGNGMACVYAHWTWHQDEKAFCTDDKDKALDFMSKANLALKH